MQFMNNTTRAFLRMRPIAFKNFRTMLRDMKNKIHINLTPQRTTKNYLFPAGFEFASSGF